MGTREDERRQLDEEWGWTEDSTEFEANNPGRLRIQPGHYAYCFPFWPLILLGVAVASLAAGIMVRWWWALPSVAVPLLWRRYFRLAAEHFWGGNVNPAKIVSLDPPLVAVHGDLALDDGRSWQVVRIKRQPLFRMAGGPPQLASGWRRWPSTGAAMPTIGPRFFQRL